jgi:hypothetical protein
MVVLNHKQDFTIENRISLFPLPGVGEVVEYFLSSHRRGTSFIFVFSVKTVKSVGHLYTLIIYFMTLLHLSRFFTLL